MKPISLRMFLTPALLVALAASASAQTTDRARIKASIDSMAKAALGGGRAAGMSIGVMQGADTLALQAYGMADLELDVPTPDRAIYEIGSVTKQFTASAILLLVEQGKIKLDDEITTYLPDYPTQGHRITIRRLMDHTSGIMGYTEMPGFGAISPQRLPRDTLVKLFSRQPFKFAPGNALAYNNSAYFLLGLIIEKASGTTYADFVKKNLFERVGMSDSRYCNEREITKRRAHGYDTGPNGLLIKAHLDHLWPYAAGSLCSTAADLLGWSAALHGGRVLSAASYRELTTPDTLNDGTRVRYAKGLMIDSLAGHRVITHGGGINGFLTDMAYFPDDRVTIAVLVNTAGPVAPGQMTQSIATLLFGRPPAPTAVRLDHPVADYAGTFRGVGRGDSLTVTATVDTAGVRLQLGNGPSNLARYVGNDTFMLGRSRFAFRREGGAVKWLNADAMSLVSRLERRSGGG